MRNDLSISDAGALRENRQLSERKKLLAVGSAQHDDPVASED